MKNGRKGINETLDKTIKTLKGRERNLGKMLKNEWTARMAGEECSEVNISETLKCENVKMWRCE